jgi:nitrate reductase molybdenum cofactor assembly chaperone NarJ/NarW
MTNPLIAAADLLHYPDAALLSKREFIADFLDETRHVSLEGMQELYTTTFDLNPVATLEAGWHLWGEQYERGRFLAELRERQDALGLDPGNELPDHLTILLPMLAVTRDPQLAAHLAASLAKIQAPLDEQGNPYRHVIRAAGDAVSALCHSMREEVSA